MKKSSTDTVPPNPQNLLKMAESMPWKADARVDVYPFQDAIVALNKRGYSFGETAEWLSKQLGAPVKRGQVYYVFKLWEAEQHEQFEEADRRGETITLPKIDLTEKDAERQAAEQDKKKRQTRRKG